jgi:hypothetical protein
MGVEDWKHDNKKATEIEKAELFKERQLELEKQREALETLRLDFVKGLDEIIADMKKTIERF